MPPVRPEALYDCIACAGAPLTVVLGAFKAMGLKGDGMVDDWRLENLQTQPELIGVTLIRKNWPLLDLAGTTIIARAVLPNLLSRAWK